MDNRCNKRHLEIRPRSRPNLMMLKYVHVNMSEGMHSSSAITDKHIDVELRERHNSAKRKRIKREFINEN